MIDAYFKTNDHYYIKRLWFRYDQITYRGSGVLIWNKDQGFQIIADIKSEKAPKRKEFHSIDLARPTRMRLELTNGMTAVTPKLRLNQLGLFWNSPQTIRIGRLILLENISEAWQNKDKWHCSALFESETNLSLPDSIHQETTIGDAKPYERFSRSGINFSGTNGEKLIGEVKENKFIHLTWAVPKPSWSKNQTWNFAEGLEYALSILTGEKIILRYREAVRDFRRAIEYNANDKPNSLGLIFRFFDDHFFDKKLLFDLASFFSNHNEPSMICKNIFLQVEESSNQKSLQSQELLLSTILEAALRSIYHLPIKPGQSAKSDPFNFSHVLKEFRHDYLDGNQENTKKWKHIIKKVEKAFSRLRHRNAHPDWLSMQNGDLSEEEIQQSINDMILLSRFYGYMILGIAGNRNLEPKFPAPLADWKPYVTFETEAV